MTKEGPKQIRVSGNHESYDEDVLTDWTLAGYGIVLKPIFEIIDQLETGRLVQVAKNMPPVAAAAQMACLFTHRTKQDPKTRLFMKSMIERIAEIIKLSGSAQHLS